jgi:hypothetical protein
MHAPGTLDRLPTNPPRNGFPRIQASCAREV